jgi:D-alanine transaminase
MAEPLPTCYLNGDYLPWESARISPFDRAFLYGDAVYEVMPVYAGRPFRFGAHCDRLTRSLAEIRMADPHTRDEWRDIIGTLIRRNGGGDQYVYWQVTRGAERGRNHAPLPEIPRTVFGFCAPFPRPSAAMLEDGVACVTAQDTRWSRCDVKATALLANVLLRQLASEVDANETILLLDGELVEGSSSAVHVVVGGELRAPPHSKRILPSITRGAVEELADRLRIPHRSVAISQAELRHADEIWLTSATRELLPVTRLDDRPVGSGKPGPVWRRVREELERYKLELAGEPW